MTHIPCRHLKLNAHIYRNFPADNSREVPAEGFGGWMKASVELPLAETALVSMHAWTCCSPREHPLTSQSQEYPKRAQRILETIFPPLLSAARSAGMTVLHVVGGGNYYQHLPAYQHAVQLAGAEPEFTGDAPHSEANIHFRALKAQYNGQSPSHREAMATEKYVVDFAPQAVPLPGEGIAENGPQLNALCRERRVSHIVYIGFAINWCLLTSPGGMRDMARRWYFCSTIREATTAVENKESARTEAHKAEALWRVSTGYGFVFDAEPFIAALRGQ
jgi:nicotinamidase-related amidase